MLVTQPPTGDRCHHRLWNSHARTHARNGLLDPPARRVWTSPQGSRTCVQAHTQKDRQAGRQTDTGTRARTQGQTERKRERQRGRERERPIRNRESERAKGVWTGEREWIGRERERVDSEREREKRTRERERWVGLIYAKG